MQVHKIQFANLQGKPEKVHLQSSGNRLSTNVHPISFSQHFNFGSKLPTCHLQMRSPAPSLLNIREVLWSLEQNKNEILSFNSK